MLISNLLKIIIKAFGIYFLYLIGIGIFGFLNSVFNALPSTTNSNQITTFIIPIVFAYIFLVKTAWLANWLLSAYDDKIQTTKPEFIHLLVVTIGFLSIILGLLNFLDLNFNSNGSGIASAYSFGINFQLGNILLIILGYLMLKRREKISSYFSMRGEESDSEEDNILK